MTFEEQNELIKSKLFDYKEWTIKDLIKQMKMYNTETGVYDEMIQTLSSELDRRNV